MFGYVVPDKPNMFIKDYTVYKAFYCGLCKSIGKKCGQLMRFTTNYDVTFLAVFMHAVLDKDVEFANEGCILNPIKKKSIVKHSELMGAIVDTNTILAHYKLVDDICDDGSAKARFADKAVVSKHYKRAKANLPEIDKAVEQGYERLRTMEKNNQAGADIVADAFAEIMRQISVVLAGDNYNANVGDIMYNVGKWVYCADALDDIDDDHKEQKYNVFLADYAYTDKATFLKDKKDELELLFMSCYDAIIKAFDSLKISKYEGVITNVLWYGLLTKTKELLRSETKCKKIRI
ncbi:MAG: DUF5685 family protein [Christensenellales bacterium]